VKLTRLKVRCHKNLIGSQGDRADVSCSHTVGEYVRSLQALVCNLHTGLALFSSYNSQHLCNAHGKEQTLNYACCYVPFFLTLSHPQFFTCYFLLQTLLLTYLHSHFPPSLIYLLSSPILHFLCPLSSLKALYVFVSNFIVSFSCLVLFSSSFLVHWSIFPFCTAIATFSPFSFLKEFLCH
jgi:hypothetical protein